MTIRTAILEALERGPQSRPQIEAHMIAVGYAPAGVPRALIQLKQAGAIQHVQRGGRYRQSLYRRNNA